MSNGERRKMDGRGIEISGEWGACSVKLIFFRGYVCDR